jgi:DNA replication protein DnaC
MEDVNYHQLSFDERLYDLLDSEYMFLKNKRISMNFKLSRIKDKQAVLEELDYDPKRKLNKSLILSLASMNFLKAKQNIIINGKTGCGKSFLAQALGNRAIHEGFTVYYIRTSTLLEEIKLSRIDGTYTNLFEICWDAKNLASARIHTWPLDA